jgi:hypothetical protein
MESAMPNENSNKPAWKTKLDDTQGLEFFLLPDKALSWEKLSGRLEKKKDRKALIWYWTAACFFIVSGVTLWMLSKNTQTVVVPSVASKPVIIKIKDNSWSKNEDAVKISVGPADSPGSKNSLLKIPTPKKISEPQKQNFEEIFPVTVAQNVVSANDLHEQVAEQNPPIKTVSLAEVLPKKKLRVVHINELGEAMEPPANFAHRDDDGALRLKLINQNVYGSSTTVPNSLSFYISRSKTVSPN